MAKLRVLSGQEVREILERAGFELVRQRGSHMIMQRHDGSYTTTVPVPDHKVIAIGTLASIIRKSGVERWLFEGK